MVVERLWKLKRWLVGFVRSLVDSPDLLLNPPLRVFMRLLFVAWWLGLTDATHPITSRDDIVAYFLCLSCVYRRLIIVACPGKGWICHFSHIHACA